MKLNINRYTIKPILEIDGNCCVTVTTYKDVNKRSTEKFVKLILSYMTCFITIVYETVIPACNK